ncbi:uncharacterized protein LOC128219888 [Mya arenaria]|nr:uncharacterized protein LOC128219888 [Mya arenaria]
MTLSTEGTCADQTFCRRMAKRLKTNEEKNEQEPGGERNVPGNSATTAATVSELTKSHTGAFGDSSVIPPSDMVKALIMAADNDMPELNRVEFARTLSDDDDAEAYDPIFEESELPPRPVKHKKKKSKDGKSLKHSSSDNEKAKPQTDN